MFHKLCMFALTAWLLCPLSASAVCVEWFYNPYTQEFLNVYLEHGQYVYRFEFFSPCLEGQTNDDNAGDEGFAPGGVAASPPGTGINSGTNDGLEGDTAEGIASPGNPGEGEPEGDTAEGDAEPGDPGA